MNTLRIILALLMATIVPSAAYARTDYRQSSSTGGMNSGGGIVPQDIQAVMIANGLQPIACSPGVVAIVVPNRGQYCAYPTPMYAGGYYVLTQDMRLQSMGGGNGSGGVNQQGTTWSNGTGGNQQGTTWSNGTGGGGVIPISTGNNISLPSNVELVSQPVQPLTQTDLNMINGQYTKYGLSPTYCQPNGIVRITVGIFRLCASPSNIYPAGNYKP